MKQEFPKYCIVESDLDPGYYYLIENAYKPDKTFMMDSVRGIVQIWGSRLTIRERQYIRAYFMS